MEQVLELGIDFNRWIEQFRTLPLDYLFLTFHHIGSKYGYFLLVPLVWFYKPKVALPLTVAALVSWGINLGLKDFFALPRPFTTGLTNPIITSSSYSFPSGHAQAAASFWGFWFFLFKVERKSLIPLAFITLIGVSRVYLGVHYFTDVLVGWAIGLMIAFATFKYCDRQKSFAAPN